MGTELAIAGMVLGGVQAYGSIMQGYAAAASYNRQAAALDAQAKMDIVKADREALKYKAQGIAILKETNRSMAASNARSGAAGLVLNTGTPGQLQVRNQSEGVNEFLISEDNAETQRLIGEMEAAQHKSMAAGARNAASSAISGGWFSAAGALAGSAFSAARLGVFGGGMPNMWDFSSAKVLAPGAETKAFFGGNYIPKI